MERTKNSEKGEQLSASKQEPAARGSSKLVTRDLLASHFHLPINDVADKLGMCVTALKQRCREYGIKRWPYRKVRKLDNMLLSLEEHSHTWMNAPDGEPVVGHSFSIAKRKLEEDAFPCEDFINQGNRLQILQQISIIKKAKSHLLSNPNSKVHVKSSVSLVGVPLSGKNGPGYLAVIDGDGGNKNKNEQSSSGNDVQSSSDSESPSIKRSRKKGSMATHRGPSPICFPVKQEIPFESLNNSVASPVLDCKSAVAQNDLIHQEAFSTPSLYLTSNVGSLGPMLEPVTVSPIPLSANSTGGESPILLAYPCGQAVGILQQQLLLEMVQLQQLQHLHQQQVLANKQGLRQPAFSMLVDQMISAKGVVDAPHYLRHDSKGDIVLPPITPSQTCGIWTAHPTISPSGMINETSLGSSTPPLPSFVVVSVEPPSSSAASWRKCHVQYKKPLEHDFLCLLGQPRSMNPPGSDGSASDPLLLTL